MKWSGRELIQRFVGMDGKQRYMKSSMDSDITVSGPEDRPQLL
jgi:hypothetical protein